MKKSMAERIIDGDDKLYKKNTKSPIIAAIASRLLIMKISKKTGHKFEKSL